VVWGLHRDTPELAATGLNAPAGWEKTLAEFGSGYVYETARTQWRLAEALAGSGHPREAADVRRAASATAAELHAEPLHAALVDLGRRLGLDADGSRNAVRDGESSVAALTRRQREVLRLMSRGLSNRQIGEELFISQKTASVHVSNILAKLGLLARFADAETGKLKAYYVPRGLPGRREYNNPPSRVGRVLKYMRFRPHVTVLNAMQVNDAVAWVMYHPSSGMKAFVDENRLAAA
jgi:DNA-binding CsgD family transcriptional regulator